MSPKTIYLVAVIASIACAPPSTTSGSHHEMNIITEDEMTSSAGENVYDVVSKLRPNFLKTRGLSSLSSPNSNYPNVYSTASRLGISTVSRT